MVAAINEVKSICKLDPERWYITGHSAGADGSWAIVQHTPDLVGPRRRCSREACSPAGRSGGSFRT